MTKAEFIDKIESGNDIMFSVDGKNFTILTWTDNGIGIGEQYPNDGELQYYSNAEELVEKFKVNGKTLGELSGKIKITQYT